ncbi:hypothetical protein D3C86_714400 [compost metagenome]
MPGGHARSALGQDAGFPIRRLASCTSTKQALPATYPPGALPNAHGVRLTR